MIERGGNLRDHRLRGDPVQRIADGDALARKRTADAGRLERVVILFDGIGKRFV